MSLKKKLDESLKALKNHLGEVGDTALILGSGLGELGDEVEKRKAVSYKKLPHFPSSSVEGHKGELVSGYLAGKKVLVFQGRFHFYEGWSLSEITYPVKVISMAGVKNIIITNAAGGVNKKFSPGDLMLLTSHINYMGGNPLIGEWDTLGPRFPDMSEVYSGEFIKKAEKSALKLKIKVQKGVYLAATGPSYETPAEIKFFRTAGADAVGMSTVPEAIVANYLGMKVLGISCISNMAAGVLKGRLSHQEVIETTNRVKKDFKKLIAEIVGQL